MNEDITNRIEQYLYLDTNYAIIINGDYGIGKTYYIKNDLFPKVREFDVPNSEKAEKFLPILISLFGAKSIEDIQNQIIVELYPIFKGKVAKFVGGLSNSALKFFGNNLNDILSETGVTDNISNEYRRILICIDDIDRKAKELELNEVFGFVNTLVENFGAKIILIANENVFRKEIKIDLDNYSLLREKVIGISVSFSAEVFKIYDEIIRSKYEKTNADYFKFLLQNKESIVSRIEQNKNNLRNLLFFLEHFKIIFIELSDFFSKDKTLVIYHLEILDKILAFTLPISIEYKSGELNPEVFEDIKSLHKVGFFDISAFLNDGPSLKGKSNEEKKKTYIEIYEEKYLDKSSQRRNLYFDSIFDYITGITSFDIKSLIAEINGKYHIEGSKIPEREKVIQKLSYWQCIDLPLKEYRKLTKQMLDFADNAEYKLEQYPRIFHFATRFKNLLNYNRTKLKKRFKNALTKGDFEYQLSLDFDIYINANIEFYDDLKEIEEYCLKVNEQIKINSDNAEVQSHFELFKKDIIAFLEKLNDPNTALRYSPIFSKFSFIKFWSVLRKATNTELVMFGFDLERRYTKGFHLDLKQEKTFLEQLKVKLELEIGKSKTRKLDKVAYEYLLKSINESIEYFV